MNCQIEVVDNTGPLGEVKGTELTVGRPFVLQCSGEWPELKAEQLEIRLDPSEQKKLKLLKFEKKSSGEAQLLVTSYQVGQHQLKALQLVDSEHSVVLGDLSFEIKSVQDPQAPQKEPFGPMGPIQFGIPLWVWFSLAVVILLVGGFAGLKLWLQRKRRIWLAEMKLHEKVLGPMAELGKELRSLQKDPSSPELVAKLSKAYRVYIARHFVIPTLHFSEEQILREMRSDHAQIFSDCGEGLRKALNELERAQAAQNSEKDIIQLIHLVRESAEAIERCLEARS